MLVHVWCSVNVCTRKCTGGNPRLTLDSFFSHALPCLEQSLSLSPELSFWAWLAGQNQSSPGVTDAHYTYSGYAGAGHPAQVLGHVHTYFLHWATSPALRYIVLRHKNASFLLTLQWLRLKTRAGCLHVCVCISFFWKHIKKTHSHVSQAILKLTVLLRQSPNHRDHRSRVLQSAQ